ncbi:MAG TPA: flavodoxin domain-containing protein [Trueperaceae bacterium]|nr:flavodoxin domain-containing protein [Trueperaceae bacterium]
MDVIAPDRGSITGQGPGPSAVVAYATLFGATEHVARLVAQALAEFTGQGVRAVDLAYLDVSTLAGHDLIVVGACTWNVGQLPPDLESSLEALGALDLRGRHVALFGTGDQIGYPDTFVDAIGVMADTFSGTGARLVGRWPAGEYDIVASRALVGGEELLGLALDEDNEPDLTQRRVASWVAQVAAEAGFRDRVSI